MSRLYCHSLYYLILLIFSTSFSYSQQYVLTNYSLEEGLPQSSILASYQDLDGNIWFGTQGGISKYNGKEFKNFDSRHGLAGNHIASILQDKSRRYWFGHRYKGITALIRSEFINIPLTEERINCIKEDMTGNIWFGTYGQGIFILPAGKDPLIENFIKVSANNDIEIFNVFDLTLNGNSAYVGTKEGLVTISFSENLDNFELNRYNPTNSDLPFTEILSFQQISSTIWAMGKTGLISFKSEIENLPENVTYYPFNKDLNISFLMNIVSDIDGVIWGVHDKGVYRFSDEEYDFDFYGTGYRNNKTYNLLCDIENNIWIGTMNLGVFKYCGDKFRIYDEADGLVNNVVLSISEDSKGKIWAATEKGISIYDGERYSHLTKYNRLPQNSVQMLFEDSKGNMWIGYYNGDYLLRYSPGSKEIRYYSEANGLKTSSVLTIAEGPDGDIWFGTLGHGVSRYSYPKNGKRDGFRTYTKEDGLCGNSFWTIYLDGDSTLWFGSDNAGLTRYDGEQFHSYNEKDGLTNLSPGALTHDSFNNLWIGSIGGGIYKFDGTIFKNYSLEHGLSSDSPFSIICDDNDNVWIGTNLGIDKFDPVKETFKHYGREEGFLGIENNQNSIFKGENGIIWFGTMNGIVRFDPSKDIVNEIPPVTIIEGVNLFFNQFDYQDYTDSIDQLSGLPFDLKLSHNLNHLTFKCIGISHTATEKVKYQYKLENFDTDWNPVTDATSITYTNVPPGDYNFQVKAANNDGIWNSQPVSMAFEIVPPYWQTWWFRIIVLIFIVTLIYGVFLYRLKTIKDQKLKLEDQVNKKTIELKHEAQERKAAQLRAEESDKLKTAFLANMSHEIRTPVNAIMGFSDLLKDPELNEEDREEYLNYIAGGGKTLISLINDIIDISKIEAGQLRVAKEPCNLESLMSEVFRTFHEFSRQKNKQHLELFPDFNSKDIELTVLTDPIRLKQVLSNLLNNAIKFTDKGSITFGYKIQDENNLLFFVKDTGIGIPNDKVEVIFERFRQVEDSFTRNYDGTGLGLAISKKLTNLMGGEMWVESVSGEGSVFYFTIPFETTGSKKEIIRHESSFSFDDCFKDKNILVVEDEDSNFILIENMLYNFDITITRAKDGISAVDIFRQNGRHYDLVLMDIKIPGMNGYEATKEIKYLNPKIPVIAQTAYALASEKESCIEAGCDDYISKPYSKQELLAVIQKHLTACHAYY